MAYLHIGMNVMVEDRRVIGIFDLDNTSTSKKREFLQGAEQEGVVQSACEDIPRSFVVCDHPYHRQIVYLSQINSRTLGKAGPRKRRVVHGRNGKDRGGYGI